MLPDSLMNSRRIKELAARLARVEQALGLPPLPPEAAGDAHGGNTQVQGPLETGAGHAVTGYADSAPAGPVGLAQPSVGDHVELQSPAAPPPVPVATSPTPTADIDEIEFEGPAAAPVHAEVDRIMNLRQTAGIDAAPIHSGFATPPPIPASALRQPLPLATLDDARQPTESPHKQPVDLENLIGGRWFAMIGAVVFVIGIGFLLKFGYDRGWFHAPPALRCLAAAALGFALLGAGEFIRRRINAAAATGAFAAGLGTIYATVYGAYRLYDLLSPTQAFILLGATALMGVGMGVFTRLPLVAVLSMIGGYTAPLLFADAPARPMVLPAYLLTLLAIGLTLTAMMGRFFGSVRTVARLATLAIGGYWALTVGAESATEALAFVAIVWAAFHAEIWYSASRDQVVGAAPTLNDPFTQSIGDINWVAWAPFMATFSVSAWTSVIGVLLSRSSHVLADWCITAGLTAATGCLAMMFAGHLDAFRQRPSNDLERLGASLHLQCAALFLVTIALLLGGWAQVTAWLILGVAAMLAGMWLSSRAFHVYGLIVLAICTARLLLIDSWSPGLTAGGQPVLGYRLSAWTLLMVLCGVCWLGAAAIVRWRSETQVEIPPKWLRVGDFCIILGWAVVGASLWHPAIELPALTAAALFTSIAMLATARQLARELVARAGIGVLASAIMMCLLTAWWFSFDAANAFDSLGLYLTYKAALPVLCSIACFSAMALLHRLGAPGWVIVRNLLLLVGIILIFSAVIHERASSQSVVWVWMALTGAMVPLAHLPPLARLDRGVAAGLLASAVCWVFAFAFNDWIWQGILAAGILAAMCFVCGRWIRSRAHLPESERTAWERVIRAMAVALIFTSTSFQVSDTAASIAQDEQVKAVAVSIWWGLFAFGSIALGFWRRIDNLRRGGLILLAVAGVKGLIIDLANAPAGWRVASFIGLGLLMMSVAVVYQKVARALAQAATDSPATPAN